LGGTKTDTVNPKTASGANTTSTNTSTAGASGEPLASKPPLAGNEHTRIAQGFIGDKFDQAQLKASDRVEMNQGPRNQMKVAARSPLVPVKTSPKVATLKPLPKEYESYPSESGGLMKTVVGLGIALGAIYFGYQQYSNRASRDLASPAEVRPLPAGARMAKLQIRIFPDGDLGRTRTTVNSQEVKFPAGVIDVPVGEPLEIVVDRTGYETYREQFVVGDGDLQGSQELIKQIKLEAMSYGLLSLSTQPAIAQVSIMRIDGRSPAGQKTTYKAVTPIELEKLPAGIYQITVRNDILNAQKTIQVEIKEGDRKVISNLPLDSN
jgi:hypothetical protein